MSNGSNTDFTNNLSTVEKFVSHLLHAKMGSCLGKQKKPQETEITERKIEVNGRTFTQRKEVSYRLSDNGEIVQTTTVYRTIAVGEKERRVIRFVN